MIDVHWLARAGTCARCRWDELFVESIITGSVKRVAGAPQIRHRMGVSKTPREYGVVVFPAGAHKESDIRWLNRQIREFRQVQLFISSDEGSSFPADQVVHRHMQLWVMTPRPEHEYLPGTIFIGEGAGERVIPGISPKTRSWFFSGQNGHVKRDELAEALADVPGGELHLNDGFMTGMDRPTYLRALEETRIAPCPGGPSTQDSFRFYEALERGCVPVVDEYRSDGGGGGFWDLLGVPGDVAQRVGHWKDFAQVRSAVETAWPWPAVRAHSWWHGERRRLHQTFVRHVPRHLRPEVEVADRMTVVVPTSPIPSHPQAGIIFETLSTIRGRTDAEILIMCDGIRPEQFHHRGDYYAYLRTLLQLCERLENVTPIVFDEHLHQAEMLRRTLELVDSEYVMYVEHDTPLEGDIPFDAILAEMDNTKLCLMRFSHEANILDVHRHLTFEGVQGTFAPWVRTLQWSQRPHIARTESYRHWLNTCFDPKARTMIEDVMHGITENAAVRSGERGWGEFKMGIYHPEGNIRRSYHLDGREGDQKYPMVFAYPGDKAPDGAPHPTVRS